MLFVNASILAAGSLLMAVPIVLHLVMRQQPRPLIFPAMRFLRQREATNRRRIWLKEWLLLATRCLLIGLLALALARPRVASDQLVPGIIVGVLTLLSLFCAGLLARSIVQRHGSITIGSLGVVTLGAVLALLQAVWGLLFQQTPGILGDQQSPVAAVLLIDTSPRMMYRVQDQTRLARAQEMARWLLRQFPSESQIAILDSGQRPGAFSVDRSAAIQAVDTLEIAYATRRWNRSWDEALGLLKQAKLPRKELYVVSDMTHATWDDLRSASLEQRLGEQPDVHLQIIDVGAPDPRNDGVSELALSQVSLTPGATLQLQARVDREGAGSPAELRVQIESSDFNGPYLVDGVVQSAPSSVVASQTVTIDSQGYATAQFSLASLPRGTHFGFVELAADDGLSLDNRRFFAVHVRDPWPILVVGGPDASTDLFTEQLAPLLFRQSGRARFVCESRSFDQLTQPIDRAHFAAVAIHDPTPLTPPMWTTLNDYLQKGGGVAMFLGRNAQSAAAFNSEASQTIMPAPLERQWRDEEGVSLAPRDYDHPLLTAFNATRDAVPWQDMPVVRHWTLGTLVAGSRSLLDWSNGQPAVVERLVGTGRLVIMTSPVTDSDRADRPAWNLLSIGDEPWPTMVLMNSLFLYLVQTHDAPLNHEAGQSAWLPAPAKPPERTAMMSPRGDWMEMTIDAKQLHLPSVEWPGIYRAAWPDESVPQGFAVNLPAHATRLARVSTDELREWLGEAHAQVAVSEDQIVRSIDQVRTGREFYPFLLPLVVVMMALEHILANRFYSSTNVSRGR